MAILTQKIYLTLITIIAFIVVSHAQSLPPKQAYPLNIKQIHSGHSLTDPLFYPHWPGQFVNLIGHVNALPAWQLFNSMVGKSTVPGSPLKFRWENPVGNGSPDARLDIKNWELLCITERGPLYYVGGNTQQWYIDGITEQRNYLSSFVNNAWNAGNNGKGTPTLLWTTWVNLDNSNGPFRQMLDTQGKEWEAMQDHANNKRPANSPPVYLIPGHKMMARLFDDIQAGLVPGITNIAQFFSDNIHTNELGAYAISMMHYACVFNANPKGLPRNLLPNAPAGTPIPSQELATYLQMMVWDVVTHYPRTGIYLPSSTTSAPDEDSFDLYPNPANQIIMIKHHSEISDKNLTYTIFNLLGEPVFSGNDNTIDISHLSPACYLLKVGNEYRKFVKSE
jgi:Secretion system C-terminal sorting domain